MAVFLRDRLEEEIERIQSRLEKDLGIKISKTKIVGMIIADYKKRHLWVILDRLYLLCRSL